VNKWLKDNPYTPAEAWFCPVGLVAAVFIAAGTYPHMGGMFLAAFVWIVPGLALGYWGDRLVKRGAKDTVGSIGTHWDVS